MLVEEEFIAISDGDDDFVETPKASEAVSYEFEGVRIKFPFPAYASQLKMMEAIIKTLNAGKSHALLESPTGSGKSLALLCAVCGWLEHQKKLLLTTPKKKASCQQDCGGCGKDFVPCDDDLPEDEDGPKLPRVYICSRTHRQIAQLIKEMRRTGYADTLQYTVLASRNHLCISETARIAPDLNEYCREKMVECIYYKKLAKMLSKPGKLQVGNRDVEELIEFGKKRTVCPYFMARESLATADIILAPYNYLVDPLIRGAMGINLDGAILMVDEAHNTEDACREAATFECTEGAVNAVVGEIGRLLIELDREGAMGRMTPQLTHLKSQAEAATLLRTMVSGLVLNDDLPRAQVRESFEGNYQIWRGDQIQPFLRAIGISLDQTKLWSEHLEKLIDAANAEEGKKHKDEQASQNLSSGSSQMLKGKLSD